MRHSRKRKLNIKGILLSLLLPAAVALAAVALFRVQVLPSVALEQTLRCDITEHIHGDGCYEGDFCTCQQAAHSHDGNCYIVLLGDNDINGILTLLGENEVHSLERVITDVMSTALVFNDDLNSAEQPEAPLEELVLSPMTVAAMNTAISDDESLPDLVLNEQINNATTWVEPEPEKEPEQEQAPEPEQEPEQEKPPLIDTEVSFLGVGDQAVTGSYKANFYVYLDRKWTCIGTLNFTTARNGGRYNSTVTTANLLNLIEDSLGLQMDYSDLDVSVASSLNGNYSTNNLSVGSINTTIGYWQNSNNAQATKYVRLIPAGGGSTSTALAFYTVNFAYPDGTVVKRYARANTEITMPEGDYEWSSGGKTYGAGEAVTITGATTFTGTMLGPVTYVNINYNVNFPNVSGVTVRTTPTIAGFSTGTVTDGYTENSSAVIHNVSQQLVTGVDDDHQYGLTRAIMFRGWRVGDTDIILQPHTTLVWEELLQYATGSSLRLTGVWDYSPLQTASFYIQYDSLALDTEGNIGDQASTSFTNELFSTYVGGVDTSLSTSTLTERFGIADKTQDNSFTADQQIRALYGATEGVWLYSLPTDEFIFESLKTYADGGYLKVDGKVVNSEDLNDREFAIRWYVFKSQSDAWHIDGKLVRKEGLIYVYKSFAGNQSLINQAKSGFYIDAHNTDDDTHVYLETASADSYDAATDTYMWELDAVEYGEHWTLTEYPNTLSDQNQDYTVYSEYTVMDAIGDQSAAGVGTSLQVQGMTYALDEGVDEVLRATFVNIYNRSDSIVIKKEDDLTGNAIGGATFQLLQNGEPLKFTYNTATESYEYDPENGTETVLKGTSNGYFELSISIKDFSYDLGNILIREVTPPEGYSLIGDIEVGYIDDQQTIGIIGGDHEMLEFYGGVLIVGNRTDKTGLTVQKQWDCPELEWKDVTMQLLANGKPASTLVSGITAQVVLNGENDWRHTWQELPVYVNGQKVTWSVRETQIGEEKAKADGNFLNWLVTYGLPSFATDEAGNEHQTITVTNTTKRVMLRLTKTDLSKTTQLPGATFLLEAVDAAGELLAGEVAKTATTGDAGTLIFDNMKSGIRYRLTETSAPEGYLGSSEPFYFTINEDGSVAVEENYFAEPGTSAYNILVRNAEIIPLPESGGGGAGMFYAMGLLLIAAAAGIYISTLRKRGCGN